MRDVIKATLIVFGALVIIGLSVVLLPLMEAVIVVAWPILLVFGAIIGLAIYLRWRRENR